LKQTIYSLSGALGVNRLFATIHRRQPIILTFHGVTADRADHFCNSEGLHLRRPIFDRLMQHVARKYRPVTLSCIVEWLEGRGEVPERAVAVTFDDGFRNVLTDAAPVLKRLGIPATLFVTTDFVFHGQMLWTDRLTAALAQTRESVLEIDLPGEKLRFDVATRSGKVHANRELNGMCKSQPQEKRLALVDQICERLGVSSDRLVSAWEGFRPIDPSELKPLTTFGITVGAHTCSHPILPRLSAAEQTRELVESKRLVEAITGQPCDQFAYPNGGPGDFNAQTRERVAEAGYRAAVTTIKRRVLGTDDRFAIPRCTLTHNRISVAEFSAELSGLPGSLRGLKARAIPRAPQGRASWGSSEEGAA
jgi:peptidoglycan/xylan/chitin deacetylase (PgdA/CDA1 family)